MELLQLLTSRGIIYHKAGRRGELWLCCPFCVERGEPGPDEKFRLGLNFIRNEGHCFRCDWRSRKGAVEDFVRAAVAGSNDDIQISYQDEGEEAKVEKVTLPEDFVPLVEVDRSDSLAYRAVKYMKKRGVSKATMRKKLIGVSLSGYYQYRIVFPVYWRGKLRGIVGRDFTGRSSIKYLNSRGSKFLYNMPNRTDRVVLAEGALKALAIEVAIEEPAAAVLGHTLTPKMKLQLQKAKCKEIVVWPDPDSIGIKGATEIAAELAQSFKLVSFIYPPPDRQADELTAEEICSLFKARVPFTWKLKTKLEAKAAFGS